MQDNLCCKWFVIAPTSSRKLRRFLGATLCRIHVGPNDSLHDFS